MVGINRRDLLGLAGVGNKAATIAGTRVVRTG
jgi:endonuclease III